MSIENEKAPPSEESGAQLELFPACSYCKAPGKILHSCPFSECTCCEVCEHQCLMDI